MKRIQAFTFLLVLASFTFPLASSVSVAPTWRGTNYIQAGSRVIVLNGAHQNGSNLYVYTYAPAFSSTPFTALGLIGFETTNLYQFLLRFWINIPNFTSTTSLQIRMTNPTATSWRQFRVSYIAVDAMFNQLRVDYFYKTGTSITNVTTGTGLRSFYGVFTLNIAAVDMTHKISIIPLLVGLYSQSVNGQHIIYWDTKLKTATTIDFNLTVDGTTRIFEFVSYILVVDRSSVEIYLQKFMDQLYIGGKNNSPVYQNPVYYNLTNMHAGLNSIRTKLIAFNFDKSSFLLTTQGYYQFINISIWSYRERQCPVPQPYYQVNTNLCYDTCPVGYVNSVGTTKQYCKACGDFIVACQQCSSTGSACTLCAGNYQPSGSTCVCPTRYYVSSAYSLYADKCRPCDTTCLTCNGPNNNNCLSCDTGRTLSSSKCVCTHGTAPNGACYSSSCSDQACVQCSTNPSLCQTCAPGFVLSGARCICSPGSYFDLATITCQPCHTSCKYCSGPSSTQCTQCDRVTNFRYLSATTKQCLCIEGYTQVSLACQSSGSSTCSEPGYKIDDNGACVEICGDGNKINYACDDGNVDDGDGCSAQCQIQAGFVCTENILAPNKRSFCSYTSPINLVLSSTRKNIYKNTIQMNITMQPTLSHVLCIYPNLLPQLQLSQPQSTTLSSAIFNCNTKLLQLQLDYTEQIQNQNLSLTLSMPLNAHTYAIPLSSASFAIQPDNKLSAAVHDQNKYNLINVFKIVGMVCMGGGIALFILLAFFRKMMGLQYVVMLQLAFFSLMLSNYQHAFLGTLQEWGYINGYNQIKVDIPPAKFVSDHFSILGYYDYFYVNCNAMIYVCFANYGLALILYVLSMLSDKSVSRKLKTSAIFFSVQIGFSLIIFSFNNIIVSMYSQAMQGHIFEFTYGLNKFFVILTLLIFCGQMGGYFVKVHEMNDSLFYYHRNKNYCHFYPFIFVARNLVIMVFVVLAASIGAVASYIVLGVQAAYIIGVFIGRPYKRIIDYIRFTVLELTLALLYACRLVEANFITNQSSVQQGTSQFRQITAFCVFAGMLLGLILTIASFAYHWWKSRTQDPEVKPEPQANQADQFYSPPMKMRDSNEKFNLRQEQKSKQLIVFDVEEQEQQQNTGAPGTNYSRTIFDQDSRRKLRSRKIKGEQSRQFF